MACLAIVQQEQGFVSVESERQITTYLGMARIAIHESRPSTTCTTSGLAASTSSTSAPICRASCATAAGAGHLETKLGSTRMGETRPTGCSPCSRARCLGACANSPVIRSMTAHVQLHEQRKARPVGERFARRAEGENAMMTGRTTPRPVPGDGCPETCFHNRRIEPQSTPDWTVPTGAAETEARGGYQALRKILSKDGAVPAADGGAAGITPEQVIADCQGARAARPRRRRLSRPA